MTRIEKLTAHGKGGTTVDEIAAELAGIMKEHGISDGQVIHNDRRYDVAIQPPYKMGIIYVTTPETAYDFR